MGTRNGRTLTDLEIGRVHDIATTGIPILKPSTTRQSHGIHQPGI